MQLYEVILIGIALSIDACAITIANCTTYKNSLTKAKEWSMTFFFALFKGIMPLIGYFIGSMFASFLAPVTKFLTAGIFLFLAVKIILDIAKDGKCEKEEKKSSCFTIGLVIVMAIATSIDALAVGVTLIDLTFSVYLAVLVIAAVTFLLVSIALLFGKTLGKLFGKYAEWVGAIILLALSIKSLIEAFL
ncbi:MAG: manganese efflux pump [Clostridia bacterium]|nr:manganese efflux pump [Clostridia bacterium]